MSHLHTWVSVNVVPIDARLSPADQIEYAEAPERQEDTTAEQFCAVCTEPLTPKTIHEDCPGPPIPDNIGELGWT